LIINTTNKNIRFSINSKERTIQPTPLNQNKPQRWIDLQNNQQQYLIDHIYYQKRTTNNIGLIINTTNNKERTVQQQLSTTTNKQRWIDDQYNQTQATDNRQHQINHWYNEHRSTTTKNIFVLIINTTNVEQRTTTLDWSLINRTTLNHNQRQRLIDNHNY